MQEFECEIGRFLDIDPKKVVTVNTGTSAVHLGLVACGIEKGDEVITPSFNNIADFQSIVALGGEPVFCDVRSDDLTIKVEEAESLITPKTKAIIGLDYGCSLMDYEALLAVAQKHGIRLLYDAAHSFGSVRENGVKVGGSEDLCTFSFDPVKNLTCIDGGAVVYHDLEEAQKAKHMRMLGQHQSQELLNSNSRSWTYDVDSVGFRYHLANLHAAIGLKQLEKIEFMKSRRREIFDRYQNGLQGLSGLYLPPKEDLDNVFPFIYVVRVLGGRRADFIDHLKGLGVETGMHWQAGHRFTHFKSFRRGPLPVTEEIVEQIVTIPMYPDLKDDECQKVIDSIRSFFA